MHELTLVIQVDENDDEIEQEILLRIKKIVLTSVDLLNFNANHTIIGSSMERTDG